MKTEGSSAASMAQTMRSVMLGSALTLTATIGWATENVTLKAIDGSIEVEGNLIAFENGIYVINTPIGEMRMAADRVDCLGAACPNLLPQAEFIVAGSDTVGDDLMPLLLEGFGQSMGAEVELEAGADEAVQVAILIGKQGFGDELAKVTIESRGSSTAFRELLSDRAAIGMASRRIKRQEARDLRDAGAGTMVSVDQERVVAVDSLLVLVSPDNPVDALSINQIAQIYGGVITNWRDVGGPDLPITVYSRDEDSGTRGVFDGRTIENRDMTLRDDAVIVSNNAEMARSVAEDAGGIGYAGFAFQRGAKSLNVITECGLVTQATNFAAKTEEYPFQRRLYLYNKAEIESEQINSFLDFVVTDAADGLVSKAGFIDLGVSRQPLDGLVERMRVAMASETEAFEVDALREVMTAAQDWDRLSTTFRVASGSTKLDAKSQRDLERLVSYLEQQPSGTRVALVGFTDDQGPAVSNQELSIERGAAIAKQVEAYAGDRLPHIDFSAMGFGELAPAACNESGNGRAINRRVEVWIR